MSADNRKVHTDALETLGNLIGPNEKRDAIHLAVIPCVAADLLKPGDHVTAKGKTTGRPHEFVGIVDPFLGNSSRQPVVQPGERFWLILYPRTITSLRHVWSHPGFTEEESSTDA